MVADDLLKEFFTIGFDAGCDLLGFDLLKEGELQVFFKVPFEEIFFFR